MSAVDEEDLKKKIIEVLKTVFDPEIPINIYDLGLIYKIDIDDEGVVNIDMTLTAPGCPIAHILVGMVAEAVRSVPGVKDVNVKLVFDPPWSPLRMTPEGRRAFKEIFGYDIVEAWIKRTGGER